MKRTDRIYQSYVAILEEELIPAMGCTEPIAIAYAAAVARKHLGLRPQRIHIGVSGNIIKNVKSVVVPHTGGLRGIPASAAAGIVAGEADKKLEVLSRVGKDQIADIKEYLKEAQFLVEQLDTPNIFDIQITLTGDKDTASARIVGTHTNLVRITHNDKILLDLPCVEQVSPQKTAESLAPEDVAHIFDRQIQYNWKIAEAGLEHSYGANIGKVLRDTYGESVHNRARYMAAAGSDARMNGCELPVIINSGSGNQGITASVPVMVYAKELQVTRDKLYRALAISNLGTIHQKTRIGTLSAYCGVVSAGCGAAAGIAYLYGGGQEEIEHTLVNSMAIASGMICDGAKASCAAKIATAVDAGLLGYHMFCMGNQFYGGDGIVKKGIENTIMTVGELANQGMAETDREIIRLMMQDSC